MSLPQKTTHVSINRLKGFMLAQLALEEAEHDHLAHCPECMLNMTAAVASELEVNFDAIQSTLGNASFRTADSEHQAGDSAGSGGPSDTTCFLRPYDELETL